jgi:hypothetical protein
MVPVANQGMAVSIVLHIQVESIQYITIQARIWRDGVTGLLCLFRKIPATLLTISSITTHNNANTKTHKEILIIDNNDSIHSIVIRTLRTNETCNKSDGEKRLLSPTIRR